MLSSAASNSLVNYLQLRQYRPKTHDEVFRCTDLCWELDLVNAPALFIRRDDLGEFPVANVPYEARP